MAMHAQEPVIDRVEIAGNKRTKTSFLLRFISLGPGDTPDSIQIAEDMRTLRTLPGIRDVEARYLESDSGNTLLFDVTERYTLLPVGDFGITDERFWIGAGAMESNFLGRGIYLYGFYRYDEEHTLHTIFRHPYLGGSKYGLEFQYRQLPTREISDWANEFINHYAYGFVSGSFEPRPENSFSLGAGLRRQYVEYLDPPVTGMPLDNLERQSVVFHGDWDIGRLDYHDFYVEGWRNSLHIESALPFTGSEPLIWVFYDQIRYYKRFGLRGNLASRLLFGLGNEQQLLYSPFVADSYYNFRGIGYRADRGNSSAILNLEYRQTLWENHWGGIQVLVFSDGGFISRSFAENQFTTWHLFAGPGLRLIYKNAYNAVLSIDYGLNLQDTATGGWVIGWGQYF